MKNSVDSFATCHFHCASEENTRSSGKLYLRPYFGHFSGIWVTFDVRKKLDSARNYKIRVKIDGYHSPYPFYLHLRCGISDLTQPVARRILKDTCLKYVHKFEPPNLMLNHEPKSLLFLCERTILLNLNELNLSVLPSISFSHLKPSTFSTQDLFIKIWYGLSTFPTKIKRMKVRQGISIAEIQWMICGKLSVQTEPSNLELYEYSSTNKLSENSYLSPHQVMFHCIVLSSIDRDSIVVSLAGQNIEQIKVDQCMTLNQFQAKVREKFALDSSSYIYFPSVCRNKNVSHCNQITMSAFLDVSTVPLIHSKQRNLPLVDGIPLSILKYENLDMYKLKISDLGLLSSNLVHAYEVTGPTIPITFRTATNIGKGEFALISDRPHAVSINLDWSVQILLKYIEEICHFPCENIVYEGNTLPHSALLKRYFANLHWQTKQSNKVQFTKDMPKVF